MKSLASLDALGSVRRTLSDLTQDGRGRILVTISFGWFLGLGMRLAAPALVPYIRADFGISLSTAGLLLSTLWFTYGLFQLPGGVLTDRIGERKVFVVSMALTTAALAASALAPSLAVLFIGFALIGSATGIYATARFTSLSDIYPDKAATAIGLSSSAGNMGNALLPAAAGLLAAAVSWRVSVAAAIPLFVAAAIGLWLTVPAYTSTQASAVDTISLATIRRLREGISGRRTLVLWIAMFLMSFVYQGFTSFYPTYLVTVKGVSEGTAAIIYSVFFVSGIVIQPIGGVAADVIGKRLSMVFFTLVGAVAVVVLLSVQGFWSLVAVSVILSAQLGFWPIAQASTIETLPAEMQGSGFGFIRMVYLLLAATAPTVVGALGDRGLFDEAFLLLAGCILLTAVLEVWFGKN